MPSSTRILLQENNGGLPPHLRRFFILGVVVVDKSETTLPSPKGGHPFIVQMGAEELLMVLSRSETHFVTNKIRDEDGTVRSTDPRMATCSEMMMDLSQFVLEPLRK